MKLLITAVFTFLLVINVRSQNISEDSIDLAQTIEWLEDKLTYNYYNEEDDEWWINRFAFNHESETVTIKNIASPKILSINDKTYLELRFKIEELNPYSIAVEEKERNAGRLVKGKTIRVGAYDNNAIRRTRNGRLSTRQSFIYFSIPKFLEDSAQNYTQTIADKLALAIELSTRLYSSPKASDNIETITSLFNERFKSENEYWVIRRPFPELFEVLILNMNRELIRKMYARIPVNNSQIELTSIYPYKTPEIYLLKSDPENGLLFSDGSRKLIFQNRNKFTYSDGDKISTFTRDGTFDPSKAKYR